MLTSEDIKLIIEAEKEVFPTKDDFEDLKKLFSSLQTSVDGYAKKADAYYQKMAVLLHKVERLEKWAKEVFEKVGVSFNFN